MTAPTGCGCWPARSAGSLPPARSACSGAVPGTPGGSVHSSIMTLGGCSAGPGAFSSARSSLTPSPARLTTGPAEREQIPQDSLEGHSLSERTSARFRAQGEQLQAAADGVLRDGTDRWVTMRSGRRPQRLRVYRVERLLLQRGLLDRTVDLRRRQSVLRMLWVRTGRYSAPRDNRTRG